MGDPVTLSLFVASTALSIGTAGAQQSGINRRANAQTREAKRQARIKQARVRREGRVRRASFAGAAGRAGVGGSIVDTTLTALDTSTDIAIQDLSAATESQLDQIGISQRGATLNNAAGLINSLGVISSEFIEGQQTKSQTDLIDESLGRLP